MNFDPQNFGEFLDAYQHYISDRRQYQAGGDTQGGGSQQQFMQQAVQAIASGKADAHDVFVQLQKMGMKQEQAAGVVEQIMTAASQLATQSQQPTVDGEVGQMGQAAYGGQLREYEGTEDTGNVNLTDGSTLSDPYTGVVNSVRTDHNMMSNVEDTPLNQTFAGMNAMGNPNSMAWMLKDTGAQGFVKKLAGIGAIAGGIGLGFQKFASPDKVTHTAAAPKGTMLATDKSGQQTSISPEEAKRRQTSQVTGQTTVQNTVGQPANVASFGQPVDPTAWQKKIPQQPGMPVFTQPKQFGYGAEVDFNDMFLPKHQSNIGTGNVGYGQPFTFAGVPGNVVTNDEPVKTDESKVSGIPYNNAGPMADGMNTTVAPVAPAANPMLDYLNKSMGNRTLNLTQDGSAKGVSKQPTTKTQTNTTKTRGDSGGIQAMSNTLNGLDLLNSTIGAGDEEKRYKENMRYEGSSDALASTNAYNPYGFHTVNDQVVQGRTANMGSIQDIGTYMATAAEGGDINIDPSKRGTFKAQATRMDMSVQEAASHILANKDQYSPEMIKKANFAKNFAKEQGGDIQDFGAYLPQYSQGSDIENYAEGGEYELTEAQIRQILANGGEIEFL